MEHCNVKEPPSEVTEMTIVDDLNSIYYGCFMSATIRTESSRTADATVKVFTGDKSVAHPNRQSILELKVPVNQTPSKLISCDVVADIPVSAPRITIGDLGRPNADYTIYAAKPRGETVDATVHAPPNRFLWGPSGNMHDLAVQCVCTGPNDQERTTVGVGEQVNLFFEPALDFHNPQWGHTGGGLSTSPTIPANGTFYTASSNAATDRVMANFPKGGGGFVTLTTTFTVLAPSGVARAQIRGTDSFGVGVAGAGMYLDVVIGPTNVSFNRVEVMEVGQAAANMTGYFISNPPPPHGSAQGANDWHPIACNNVATDGNFDHCLTPSCPGPWNPGGGFTWPIPALWKVGNGPTHSLPWSDQVFSLQGNGTMTITKFGKSVTRTINNQISTQ
jgi:hypothetical protein